MKNIVYIVLLTTQFFIAQSGFEKGNDFYRKGNYEQAILQYESVLASKQHSSELYFNLAKQLKTKYYGTKSRFEIQKILRRR